MCLGAVFGSSGLMSPAAMDSLIKREIEADADLSSPNRSLSEALAPGRLRCRAKDAEYQRNKGAASSNFSSPPMPSLLCRNNHHRNDKGRNIDDNRHRVS